MPSAVQARNLASLVRATHGPQRSIGSRLHQQARGAPPPPADRVNGRLCHRDIHGCAGV